MKIDRGPGRIRASPPAPALCVRSGLDFFPRVVSLILLLPSMVRRLWRECQSVKKTSPQRLSGDGASLLSPQGINLAQQAVSQCWALLFRLSKALRWREEYALEVRLAERRVHHRSSAIIAQDY
jgi:hypothetical protein